MTLGLIKLLKGSHVPEMRYEYNSGKNYRACIYEISRMFNLPERSQKEMLDLFRL